MQNNIDKRKIKLLDQISYTMAKTTTLFVLVILVAVILNGYSAECVGRGKPTGERWHCLQISKGDSDAVVDSLCVVA
jgi:hypothetical protein